MSVMLQSSVLAASRSDCTGPHYLLSLLYGRVVRPSANLSIGFAENLKAVLERQLCPNRDDFLSFPNHINDDHNIQHRPIHNQRQI